MEKEGVFIVFEGVDGSGKDTQLALLQEYMKEKKIDYVLVRDPSDEVCGFIREALLNNNSLENSTRLYMYMAARSELIYKQILPALKEGKVVLCNRFKLSTYCYQGVFFSREEIDTLSRIGGLEVVQPDLQIVYLTKESFRPMESEDVMGLYCNEYRRQIIDKYVNMAKEPELKIELIWADKGNIDGVQQKTIEKIKKVL